MSKLNDCGCNKQKFNWLRSVIITSYVNDGSGGIVLYYEENGFPKQRLLKAYEINILASKVGKRVIDILREVSI